MILSGALHDREEAKAYYRDVAQAQAIEVRNWQKLSGLENLSLFTGFQPVSYTHLDVYKRQGYDRP